MCDLQDLLCELTALLQALNEFLNSVEYIAIKIKK